MAMARGFLLLLISLIKGSVAVEGEYRLITDLLASYDVNVRPVVNQSDAVTVQIGMALNQIIDLDERNQVITVKAWMRYRWTDANLVWNSSAYNGITTLRLSANRVWRPDITLYTDLRDGPSGAEKVYPVVVNMNGEVRWNLPDILRSTCDLDVTYFPWDEQRCTLQFGSWTYDGAAIDAVNMTASGDLSNFAKSGEWTFVAFPIRRHEEYYGCCVNPFPDVTFYLILRRKPLYYLFNLILPCVFITATTVFVFYLPPESGEKVSLGVTVLLALTVVLLLVAEIMPPQSDTVPIIGQYFEATVVLLAISTALTVVVLNIHHRGMFGNEVPLWIRKLVLDWMARPLCLKGKVDKNLSKSTSNKVMSDSRDGKKDAISNGVVVVEDIEHYPSVDEKTAVTTTDKLLMRIADTLNEFRLTQRQSEKAEGCKTDWMLVAVVIDRFLLVVFVFLTVIVSAAILTNHPAYVDGVYDPVK